MLSSDAGEPAGGSSDDAGALDVAGTSHVTAVHFGSDRAKTGSSSDAAIASVQRRWREAAEARPANRRSRPAAAKTTSEALSRIESAIISSPYLPERLSGVPLFAAGAASPAR